MKILLTGGTGFIGRWTLKELIGRGHAVEIFDDLSNSSLDNIAEFRGNPALVKVHVGDIKDAGLLKKVFAEGAFDSVLHLAASIIVQESIDNPKKVFDNDVIGSFNVIEEARKHGCSFLFMSTCMVYSRAGMDSKISEKHPVFPASPYAACKLAGENLTISYHQAYGMKTLVVRPFNTYGPYQKSNMEGGVVPIFVKLAMDGKPLKIYGDGTQTRDLLYVEDCSRFLALALEKCHAGQLNGTIMNAGTGTDISVNDLAKMVSGGRSEIVHVPHIHPQAEIPKLLCDSAMAERILGWKPEVSLAEGVEIMRKHFSDR